MDVLQDQLALDLLQHQLIYGGINQSIQVKRLPNHAGSGSGSVQIPYPCQAKNDERVIR